MFIYIYKFWVELKKLTIHTQAIQIVDEIFIFRTNLEKFSITSLFWWRNKLIYILDGQSTFSAIFIFRLTIPLTFILF